MSNRRAMLRIIGMLEQGGREKILDVSTFESARTAGRSRKGRSDEFRLDREFHQVVYAHRGTRRGHAELDAEVRALELPVR